MAGFTIEQRTELKELLDDQRSGIMEDVKTAMDDQRSGIMEDVKTTLDDQRSAMMLDMTSLVRAELQDIRDRLDRLFKMATEDTLKLNEELTSLKRRVAILEKKFA
jgi:DNA-binding transcriptional MerR regulator